MESGVTFCLVTGASRGIGQQIAIQIAPTLPNGSIVLLLSRTLYGLQETKKHINEIAPNVRVVVETLDFEVDNSNEKYATVINDALKESSKVVSNISHAVVIHNAGNLFSSLALELTDSTFLKKDLQLNFTSPVLLNTQFFKIFNKNIPKRIVVQTSSILSKITCETASVYGAIKSARNQFFRTLAVEEPTIQVLNYDPGMVDTTLFRNVYSDDSSQLEAAGLFWSSMGYRVIQPEKSAAALLEILATDFESGSFLNFAKNPNLHKEIIRKYGEHLKKSGVGK